MSYDCTDESYYECLGKRFHRTLGQPIIGSEENSFRDICAPFTLPFGENPVPLCRNDSIRRRYEETILQLEADQDKYCKKSCSTKEFKIEVRKQISKYETNKFGFQYQFEVPKSTKDHMSRKPFKIIKKEYLILNEMSLIGNVGGTLGMFVGFSFIGTIEWLLDILSKVKNHIKIKQTCN